MHILTKSDLLSNVATRWAMRYEKCPEKHETSQKLLDLGGKGTEDQVTEIIGNNSWTKITCDQCGADVDRVVYVGQPLDYGSSTAKLCSSCVRAALNLLHHSSPEE